MLTLDGNNHMKDYILIKSSWVYDMPIFKKMQMLHTQSHILQENFTMDRKKNYKKVIITYCRFLILQVT